MNNNIIIKLEFEEIFFEVNISFDISIKEIGLCFVRKIGRFPPSGKKFKLFRMEKEFEEF